MRNRSLFAFIVSALVVAGASFTFTKLGSAQGNPNPAGLENKPVCPGPAAEGGVRCHARVIVEPDGSVKTTALPSGYGPTQFRGAYNLPGAASATQIVAIVDAYNHPNILSDLNTYSKTFGIPPMVSCPVSSGTVSSPCFQKVDQRGGINYPATNSGWALEIALDVEIAHAVCQNCNILLVEADSNSYSNLMAAVDRARLMGASIISNSYGSSEFSGETGYDDHFNHPGTVFTFSSGDSGYGVDYPASSPYVTAVGGTTLNLSGNSYVSELAWSGSGSGCSLYENKPTFQQDLGCLKRTVADVSADADPNTGAAVYDSVRYFGRRGWFKIGGTSLSSPLIAGVYALAGAVNSNTQANSIPYSLGSSINLHDVLSGSNGSCGGSYLCTSGPGYDGPTGLGTPNGTSAF